MSATPAPPRAWDDFEPRTLRSYAVLADRYRGALVGPRGEVCWLCFPSWEDDAVLGSLVGAEGVYAVTPVGTAVSGGSYEEGTLVWRHRWTTTDGFVECHDALATPARRDTLRLLRRLVGVSGPARFRVVLDLRARFGDAAVRDVRRDGDGTWTGRVGDVRFRWSGARRGVRFDRVGHRFVAQVDVAPDSHVDLLLELSTGRLERPVPATEELWRETREDWADAVPRFDASLAPREARQAYAVLRGLTRPGGGMVAAATLGLPERSGAARSYDYRYVWLRDQAYAGLAAGVDEPHALLDDAVAFAVARVLEHGPDLAPAYTADGGRLPDERSLGLVGYPGGTDVVGNHVNAQFQLDTVGELLQLLACAAVHDHLDTDGSRALDVLVGLVRDRWDAPDAGIWELHDDWWTQSRLAAVAGLRAAAAVVGPPRAGELAGLADVVLARTSERCLRPDGAWARRPGDPGTDASLVLPPVRGALPANDPRTVATLAAVERELVQDGFVYRFAQDDRPLGEAEGAFLLCGFTTALAHWHAGDRTHAFAWFQRTAGAGGSPGILSEELDVEQRQLRGNLPQAFVHALVLEAAQRLPHDPVEGSVITPAGSGRARRPARGPSRRPA